MDILRIAGWKSQTKLLLNWYSYRVSHNYAVEECSSEPPGRTPRVKINLRFDDHVVAFKSKTNWELMRAYIVYQLTSIRPLVDNNVVVMDRCQKIMGKYLFGQLMRLTFYGHFVAGEDEKDIMPLIRKLNSNGVGFILGYSVEEDYSVNKRGQKTGVHTSLPEYKQLNRREKVIAARTYFYQSEKSCDRHMESFLKCIQTTAESGYKNSLFAIKLTALCKPKLLLEVSEIITRVLQYKAQLNEKAVAPLLKPTPLEESLDKFQCNSDNEGFTKNVAGEQDSSNAFPWSGIINDSFEVNEVFQVPDPKTGEMVKFLSQLTPEEEAHFHNLVHRLNTIVRAAADSGVRCIVDAEQTYFQPAISRLTVEMMRKYNKNQGIVYNTYQNYLKTAYDEVVNDMDQAEKQDFYFRGKIVRGAYIRQERERAKEMGYEDPTNPTPEATTENYHRTMVECFKRIRTLRDRGITEKKIAVMIASHNEDTVRMALQKMDEIGILPEDGTIQFGQLLGMCDFISYPLGDGGYGIHKYVPYGPLHEVLPYLSRRVNENRGILKNVAKEKKLLASELRRRLTQFGRAKAKQ